VSSLMDDKLSLQQLTPRRFLHPVPYWATLHLSLIHI